MKESSTYQAILEEGRAEGRAEGELHGAVAALKKMLRLLGDAAFGPPDPHTAVAIERLEDLPRLEELLQRLNTAGSWHELLKQPHGRRGGRRQ